MTAAIIANIPHASILEDLTGKATMLATSSNTSNSTEKHCRCGRPKGSKQKERNSGMLITDNHRYGLGGDSRQYRLIVIGMLP